MNVWIRATSNYWQTRKKVEEFNASNKYKKRGVFIVPMKMSAIRQAIYSYREDHGTQGTWTLDIPLTSERIRLACQDGITKFITDNDNVPQGAEVSFNIMQ